MDDFYIYIEGRGNIFNYELPKKYSFDHEWKVSLSSITFHTIPRTFNGDETVRIETYEWKGEKFRFTNGVFHSNFNILDTNEITKISLDLNSEKLLGKGLFKNIDDLVTFKYDGDDFEGDMGIFYKDIFEYTFASNQFTSINELITYCNGELEPKGALFSNEGDKIKIMKKKNCAIYLSNGLDYIFGFDESTLELGLDKIANHKPRLVPNSIIVLTNLVVNSIYNSIHLPILKKLTFNSSLMEKGYSSEQYMKVKPNRALETLQFELINDDGHLIPLHDGDKVDLVLHLTKN